MAADFSRRELLEGATLGLRTPRWPRWNGLKRQIELAAGKTLAFGLLAKRYNASPQPCIWHRAAPVRTHFDITKVAQANFAQPKRLGKAGSY